MLFLWERKFGSQSGSEVLWNERPNTGKLVVKIAFVPTNPPRKADSCSKPLFLDS